MQMLPPQTRGPSAAPVRASGAGADALVPLVGVIDDVIGAGPETGASGVAKGLTVLVSVSVARASLSP